MPRRLKNTRIKNGKLQVYIRVHPGPGGLKTQTVERTSRRAADIEKWCTEQRKKFGGHQDAASGFRAAAADYIARRARPPGRYRQSLHPDFERLGQRLRHHRSPLSIDTSEITDVINRWTPTYSADYLHKRRGVLFTFYGTMYPTHANPVRDAKNPKPTEPEARELSYLDIDRAIQSMPTHAYHTGRPVNLAKIRLRVQAETGLPPGIVGQDPAGRSQPRCRHPARHGTRQRRRD